jgi:hypothetical protein
VEIRVKPEPDDREAVIAAAQALLSRDPEPPPYASEWRRRGILESVGRDYDDAVRPRSSPGASRA